MNQAKRELVGRHIIVLSNSDLELIVAALDAVAPTGGGSDQFHLARRLREDANLNEDVLCRLTGQLQTTAHQEYEDAHAP